MVALLQPTEATSRANCPCGLTDSHTVPQLMCRREKINSRGIKWLPICEHPVLIRLLILGSSLVLELSLSIRLSTKGHRSSWKGEGSLTARTGFRNVKTMSSNPNTMQICVGPWIVSSISTDVLSLIKLILMIEGVPSSVFT